jgi:membrane associated rhomboid family serine protease
MAFFALPYRVNRPYKRFPVMTVGLIVVNTLVFFLTVSDLRHIAYAYGFRPNASAYYTWFTSMFLHGDFFGHLGYNMFFLWLFGSVVEDAIGKLRFSVIYLAGGLAAVLVNGIVSGLFVPGAADIPLIGASGAIAAIMGVFAVRFYKTDLSLAFFVWFFVYIRWGVWHLTSLAGVGLWFAREFITGLLSLGATGGGVAHWAHIGGLAFGAVVALVFGLVKDADWEYLGDDAAKHAKDGSALVAAAEYAQLAETEPDRPDWYLGRAQAMLRTGRPQGWAEAAKDLSRAVEMFVRTGRSDEALKSFQALPKTVWQIPLDARTFLALGSIAEGHQEYRWARVLYAEAARRFPETREGEKSFFRLAHVCLALQLPDAARLAWNSFLARYPDSDWIAFADKAVLELTAPSGPAGLA